jgi:hypothetical protein
MATGRVVKRLLWGVGVLAALAIAAGFVRFKRFVDEDPRLCATCHRSSPEFALWTGSSHRGVACQRCHHASPAEGVAMLRAFVAGRSPAGSHADVEVGACAKCHLSHDPRWPQVGSSRGHRIHAEQQKIACVRCHATSVHGFEPVSARCVECHGAHAVRVPGMAKLHCFACHDFLSTEPGLRPTRRDCLRCHAAQGVGAPFAEHGGPMEMACAACHKPHAKDGEPTLAACTGCHAQMARGGLHARAGHARCVECHRPHLWKAEEADCTRCHARAAGHAAGKRCVECHPFGGAPLPPRPAALP